MNYEEIDHEFSMMKYMGNNKTGEHGKNFLNPFAEYEQLIHDIIDEQNFKNKKEQ